MLNLNSQRMRRFFNRYSPLRIAWTSCSSFLRRRCTATGSPWHGRMHTEEYANSTVGLDCEVFPRAMRRRYTLTDFAQIPITRAVHKYRQLVIHKIRALSCMGKSRGNISQLLFCVALPRRSYC